MRVFYTDPAWLHSGKTVDPALATIEAEVLAGHATVQFGPFADGRYQLDRVVEHVAGVDVLVVYRCQVTEQLLDAVGPTLKAVIRQGVGVDNLNAELLEQRGVPGYNVPDYCVDEVSTHTTVLALALERAVVAQHRTLTEGTFDIYAGGVPRRTSSRTLGIVGFGRIGRAVGRKLGVHYGRTLVYDPYVGRDLAAGYGAQAVDTLPELLAAADMVSLHCPLNAETDRMFDRATFAHMRAGSYLVNAARGRLVDPGALAEALETGRIAGAGLDVFAPENPHDDVAWHPVLGHPNVVVSSHRAFLSSDAEQSSRRRVAELARDVLAGKTRLVGRVLP